MPPTTRGVHHIGLTVRSVDTASQFFVDALGFDVVGGRPSYPSVFVSDGTTMVTLWQAADPATAADFDRRNTIGLHHLALAVDSDSTLDRIALALAARPDVVVEFGPEPLGTVGARHMMFIGPSGLRIELIRPAT